MAHFAKVANGVVVQVIVAEPGFFETFVDTSPGEWLQTSYNTKGGIHYGSDGKPDGGVPLRKNFAGVGYAYDAQRDAFIPPKPFASWVLDEESCTWSAPIPKPSDGMYEWDEVAQAWVAINQP